MGNYISVQLTLFLRSILLGAVLGLAYDWARALRTLGGRLWGGLLDAAYCLGAVSSVFLFVLAGDGELRFFVLAGALGGALLFFILLSRPLRPVWDFWVQVFLSPVRLLCRFLQKGERRGKKCLSFCRSWIIMKWKERQTPPREGDEQMGDTRKRQPPRGSQKKREQPKSKVTLWLVVLLTATACVLLVVMAGKIQRAREEEAAYAAYLEELTETNEQLKEDIANSDDPALIQEIARDKLGLVFSDEKEFHFSS